MSKKCCGFIYSDEEQNCRICGKELVDELDVDEIMESVSSIQAQIEAELAEPITGEPQQEEEIPSEEMSGVQTTEETDTKNMMDILDEVVEEQTAADNAKIQPGEEKASTGIKIVGIISIVLAVLGIAMVGICIYFMVIKPAYVKDGEADKQLIFPEISTNSDVELAAPRDYISLIPLATSTDAIYVPVNPDIEETDTTVTDATATDADVVE